MTEQTLLESTEQQETPPRPLGMIVAENILAEDFEARYEGHYEWVRGYVIKMSPISGTHDDLSGYLYMLLQTFFALLPIGRLRRDPFTMRLDAIQSRRQPDIQVILNSNPGQLTETAMIGPADICIEIVSPGSDATDYGDKLVEYEQGGVTEYWLLDPKRQNALFRRLNSEGIYIAQPLDNDEAYHTDLLPGFKLHVPTLWQSPLPDILQVVESVQAMLK